MNERQLRFADEYLIDLNAEAAAIRAGYSPRYARGNAYKLVANGGIAEYIAKRQKDRAKRTEISQDDVIKEYSIIANAKITDYVKVVEKEMFVEIDGKMVAVLDADGNPVKYKTVEPVLTDELTEEQKKAIQVIQKGRDGFIIKTYDKLAALEKLGKHLGMWDKKEEDADNQQNDGFIEALQNEVADVWEE